MPCIIGWDIGGVNTKAARLRPDRKGPVLDSVSLPYELQLCPRALAEALAGAGKQLDRQTGDQHAVTMTAELSQAFRTKREGVTFVLEALASAFPDDRLHVYTVDGRFVSPATALCDPLAVSASNWVATAAWVARSTPTCLLLDVGSTTTDIIPIVDGEIATRSRTDADRLLSGELVYTGTLRTPAEAVSTRVPLWGGSAAVSAEGFALIGDAHLWLGHLAPGDYSCRTPDGRPGTREFAGERLARLVCADREMLDDDAIDRIAAALAGEQLRTIVSAIDAVRSRWPSITTAVVAGLGEFIAAESARAAGLEVVQLGDRLGAAARVAPAAAVAWLLWLSTAPEP